MYRENPLFFAMGMNEAAGWWGLWWIDSALAATGFWREWWDEWWR